MKITSRIIAFLIVLAASGGLLCGMTEMVKLLASDGAADDRFGVAVSIDNDTALIGSYRDDDNGATSGSAYVFIREGTAWTQQAKLLPADGAAGDNFGYGVNLDGDTAIIGACLDDDNGLDSGSAYVFVRNGTTWTQQAKLLPADGAAGDNFGYRVNLDGDTALMAAFLDDDNGLDSGSAYVFVREGTTWTQQAKLLPADGDEDDQFGRGKVSIDGDTAIIGAFLDDDNGLDSGSAYVFVREGTTWTQQAKLLPADGDEDDQFGRGKVSIDGDTAIIGAFLDDDNGLDSGSAYVFVREGTTWTQQAKLLPADGAEGDGFGVRVSLGGNIALVGTHGDDDNGATSGSAYVFVRNGTTWTEQEKLLASDGYDGDRFGFATSVSSGLNAVAVIGAYLDDDNGDDSGSAYVFQLSPAITAQPQNQIVRLNESASFSVAATDADSYQWYRNGFLIAGATTDSYNVPAATAADAGRYHVVVTNTLGSTTSEPAWLYIKGAVVGWGSDDDGRATPPDGLMDILAVSAGFDSSLALQSDRTVVAWGNNDYGQATPPVGLNDVVAISAGTHCLALKNDGTVVGWGRDNAGQATPPGGLNDVTDIKAGGQHSIALKRNGTVIGWGNNNYGQATPPVGLTDVVDIAAGGIHCLALKSDGTVVGWGNDEYGQATPPGALTDVIAIEAHNRLSLALKSDGTVVGWGKDNYGETSPPGGLTDAVAIEAGGFHGLAIKSDGTVVGWGFNNNGQGESPPGLIEVAAISAGYYHNLAVRDYEGPIITQQPQSQTITAGKSVTFTAQATGAPDPTFQWRKDAVMS